MSVAYACGLCLPSVSGDFQISVPDITSTSQIFCPLVFDHWLLGEEVASSVGSIASGVVAKRLNHPHAVSLSVDQLLSELDGDSAVSVVGMAVSSSEKHLLSSTRNVISSAAWTMPRFGMTTLNFASLVVTLFGCSGDCTYIRRGMKVSKCLREWVSCISECHTKEARRMSSHNFLQSLTRSAYSTPRRATTRP
jgi:hypothetical protein